MIDLEKDVTKLWLVKFDTHEENYIAPNLFELNKLIEKELEVCNYNLLEIKFISYMNLNDISLLDISSIKNKLYDEKTVILCLEEEKEYFENTYTKPNELVVCDKNYKIKLIGTGNNLRNLIMSNAFFKKTLLSFNSKYYKEIYKNLTSRFINYDLEDFNIKVLD